VSGNRRSDPAAFTAVTHGTEGSSEFCDADGDDGGGGAGDGDGTVATKVAAATDRDANRARFIDMLPAPLRYCDTNAHDAARKTFPRAQIETTRTHPSMSVRARTRPEQFFFLNARRRRRRRRRRWR
jgi:hypothetical protein